MAQDTSSRNNATGFDEANKYFQAIRNCWAPLANHGCIIPFCTPLVVKPRAFVIGTNHSQFDKNPELADEIANRYAAELPTENTFLCHNHVFASRLRKCTREAGIDVTENWVGTNRCAVQTGTGGIRELKREPEFRECQRTMDELLVELIGKLQPVNVLLFGQHAYGLFYRPRSGSLAPIFIDGGQTKVIPLPHLSFRRSPSEIIDKLRAEFVRGTAQ